MRKLLENSFSVGDSLREMHRPEYRYYREAAARAVEIHARDSDLAPFYREIVREEDADREHHHQWAVMEDGYWNWK